VNTKAANYLPLTGGTLTGTTASSSPSTGALTIPNGGLGVGGAVNVGGGVTAQTVIIDNGSSDGGNLSLKSSGFPTTEIDNVSGVLRIWNGTTFAPVSIKTADGSLSIASTVASSSPSTGALTVGGGAGISGAANIGGGINATGAGGPGPIITSIDSRGSGATLSIAANFNGLGQPGLYTTGAFPMQFGINSLMKMQLTAAGDLQVLNGTASSSPTTGALTVAGGVGVSGNIYCGGGGFKPSGGPWADSSDARIKSVVGDYEHGLAEVLQLTPKRYTYKGNDTVEPTTASKFPYEDSPHYSVAIAGTEYIGLIAQEIETVMPEMVTLASGYIDGKNKIHDIRRLDTGALIYALVNAVKELNARVQALEGAAI
jgi:Chaperone of endosialidase